MAKSAYCKLICERNGCLGDLCPLIEGNKKSKTPATTRADEIQEQAIDAWRNGLDEKEIERLIRQGRIER